ncbi:MAG: FkbM family methyltransferase [Terriglobales bacterium]
MMSPSPATVLRKAGTVLDALGIHERLRASRLYDLYWSRAAPELAARTRREQEFYRRLLPQLRKGDTIFDVGANVGQKTAAFLRLGARVIAVEPDARCRRVLAEKFLRWRLRPRPVSIVHAAVGRAPGRATMWVDAPGSALNTLSPKWAQALREDGARAGGEFEFAAHREVAVTTIDDLASEFGLPRFLKIDVEGFEEEVLLGMRRPVPLLSFEVNLPEFLPEGLRCIGILESLAPAGSFNLTGDCSRGFDLPVWARAADAAIALSACRDHSTEIFWRAPEGP